MKFASALLPVAAVAVDDDTMMLSMGRMAVDAESSVHSLMEAASARNVTQMESLMQALVEETIQGDGVEQLDEDIKKALYVIRGNLVDAIRNSLTGEHKVDQDYIMEQLKCFDECKHGKGKDQKHCEDYDKESFALEKSHVSCRTKLFAQYVKKIETCGALDDWVFSFELTPKPVEFCVYDAQYKCHYKECKDERSSTCTPEIDGYFGQWLQKIIAEATAGYEIWYRMHLACKAHYHSYIEIDSQCDVTQGQFEWSVCAGRQCRYSGCTVDYAACRDRCIAEYHRTVKRIECAEKDRKIDWSASEKIECYLRILLASPTNEQLQENCSDASKCLNEWRTREYNKCNDVCPQVDFESGGYSQHHRRHGQSGEGLNPDELLHEGQQAFRQFADNQVPGDRTHGVNTTHRVSDKADPKLEKRCTQHLDIDFQPIPCADPCPPPPPSPCEEVFIAKYYHQFLQMTQIDKLSDERKCHEDAPGEHTEKWAYNLCECRECSPCTGTPHNREDDYCTDTDSCPAIVRGLDYYHGGDYKQVHLSSAEKCQALCTWESQCNSFAYTASNTVCYLKTGVPTLVDAHHVDSGLPCPFGPPRIIDDTPHVSR